MFYAGDGIDTEHYHIGVARSYDIKGPFEKFGRQILHLDEDTYDAGKNCTFVGPGNNYVAFMVPRNTRLIQLLVKKPNSIDKHLIILILVLKVYLS